MISTPRKLIDEKLTETSTEVMTTKAVRDMIYNALLVRTGSTIDDKVAGERANNIATMLIGITVK